MFVVFFWFDGSILHVVLLKLDAITWLLYNVDLSLVQCTIQYSRCCCFCFQRRQLLGDNLQGCFEDSLLAASNYYLECITNDVQSSANSNCAANGDGPEPS